METISFSIGDLISIASLAIAIGGGVFWAGLHTKGARVLEAQVAAIWKKIEEREARSAARLEREIGRIFSVMNERDEKLSTALINLETTLDERIAKKVNLNCPILERERKENSRGK